ncbi:MAG: hypothetical protein Q9161_006522 [Pseudevernia consocians]
MEELLFLPANPTTTNNDVNLSLPANPSITDNDVNLSVPANPPIKNNDLNLSVLQAHMPDIIGIKFTAPYAVVYKFSTTAHAWEKTGVEGTVFVVESDVHGYAVVVLNRRGLDNFVLHLKSLDDIDVTPEYVILQAEQKNDSGIEEVAFGLWVFEEQQGSTNGVRQAFGRCVLECASMIDAKRVNGTPSGLPRELDWLLPPSMSSNAAM